MADNGIQVIIHDNSPEVIAALQNAVERALFAVGQEAVGKAQDYVTKEHRIDTGRMRRSISHNEYIGKQKRYTAIGTNVYYAIYQEMGTSRGISPAYFLTRAAKNHTEEYKKIIMDSIKNA